MQMDPRNDAEVYLLNADRAYGISAGQEAVRKALEHDDDGVSFTEWVMQHLSPDNLLTPDELSSYSALQQFGHVETLSRSQEHAQVHAVEEEELRRAIKELSRSTEAIEKQTEILHLQRQALDRLAQKRSSTATHRGDLEERQGRKFGVEHKALVAEVESLSHGIDEGLIDITEHHEAVSSSLRAAVRDTLQSDDVLLLSLQKLIKELDCPDPEGTQSVDRMKETSLRIIMATVETIRTRLDRVYLQALMATSYQHHETSSTSADIKAMGEELESLYSEILPVAQMSVEQQHLDPAVLKQSTRDRRRLAQSTAALSYISECFEHLHSKGTCLRKDVRSAILHHAKPAGLISQAREELSASTSPPQNPTEVPPPASPVRLPPMRRRPGPTQSGRTRRSSVSTDLPPMEILLETLGIHTPDDQPCSRLQAAGRAVSDRTLKGDDMLENGQDSYEALTASHLDDLSIATQILSDSALAETSYSTVRFIDPDFEASINDLKQDITEASEALSLLEMKHEGKKSEKKDEMIRRWAA